MTARLTHRDDFTAAVRHGRRGGRRLVVMHVLLADPDSPGAAVPARVGFIVSKAVGGSVVRHRVARRLRHLMRDRLTAAPTGARIVVRALPSSATAESADLGRDLDRALTAALSVAAGGADRSGADRSGADGAGRSGAGRAPAGRAPVGTSAGSSPRSRP